MLQYGEGDVGSLAAASDVAEALRCAAQIVNAMKPREVLARRAQALNGQRGGRPPGETFRVLSAVARLKASAGHGDRRAEVELKLLRTFLLEA